MKPPVTKPNNARHSGVRLHADEPDMDAERAEFFILLTIGTLALLVVFQLSLLG